MPKPARPHKKGVRLSDEENWYCEALSRLKGIDSSGVFRTYMLKGAREEGLVYPGPPPPLKKKAPTPKRRGSQ